MKIKMTSILQQLFVPLLLPAIITFIAIQQLQQPNKQKNWIDYGLLYIIFMLGIQLFILPLTPLTFQQGKLTTNVYPSDLPSLFYRFALFGLFPIYFSSLFPTVSKPLTLAIGFFIGTFIVQTVQPLDVMITLVLFVSGYHLIKQQNKTLSSTHLALSFVLLFTIVATSFRFIPMYTELASYINHHISSINTSFLSYSQHIGTLLMIPFTFSQLIATQTKEQTHIDLSYTVGVLVGLFTQLQLLR